MREIDADQVLAVAREHGLDWIDRETAARIAAGASAALSALREPAGSADDPAPSDFIGELAALAHEDA
jgi:hypothetical protein